MKNKISLRWKLFTYMALFTAGMLGSLWLYQLFFMQDFFKLSKVDDLNAIAKEIRNVDLKAGDFEEKISQLSFENNTCILMTDQSGQKIVSAGHSSNCLIHDLSGETLEELAQSVSTDGSKPVEITPAVRALLAGQSPSAPEKTSSSSRVVMALRSNGRLIFLDSSAVPPKATLNSLYIELLYAGGFFLVLTFLLTTLISRGISKPIKILNNSARELSMGNFDVRFEGNGYLEIAQLSEMLNDMVKEFKQFETLRQDLIADVSHDLRTPLAAILSRCELVSDFPEEDARENIRMICDEATWMSNLVNNLLKISKLRAKPDSLDVTRFDITHEIEGILRRFERLYQRDGYKFEFDHGQAVCVKADKIRICQVIYNFVHNAVKHAGEDKKVTVTQKTGDGEVLVQFHNSGDVIPREQIKYIWNRYYQVEDQDGSDENGVGLGLSIIKSILEVHQSRYGVETHSEGGCTFWFTLKLDEDGGDADNRNKTGKKRKADEAQRVRGIYQ